MALTQGFYNLRNLRLICTLAGGTGSGVIDLSIKRNPVYANRWAGQAVTPSQSYNGENFPDITMTVYNDDDMNFATAVPNSQIENFELVSPNDGDASFLGDLFDKFPLAGWVIGGPDTVINGSDNTTFKIPIMTNVMNPGVDGGFPA